MSDDKPDKTFIVNPDITIKVKSDVKPVLPKVHPLNFTHFKDYKIVYPYPATGGEADIFRISKNDDEFILKLYRTGCVPKEEVLRKIKKLSEEHQEHFIRLIDYGIDSDTGRWYERLEYAKYQTLKEIIDKNDDKQLNFEKILSEIFYSIETLHQHNIIHQDIKPSNILVRSIDPIDLVLADFGMASSFTDDVRQTDLGKGTAHYQAPEQLSGIVSPKTDYWALGMILLEIKNGKHPFKGFDLQHIKFALVTQGVEVSSELPPRDAMLIKGLLTRDPKNRWGAEEVKKWISGDNDIPLFYDYNLGNQQPYTFQGNNYFTPSELVAQFIKDENNWQEARKHLARGYLLKWFEDIKDFDHAVLLNDFRKLKNVDEQLFSVIYSINNKLPFVVYGKMIDLNNLYLFSANYVKNTASEAESSVITSIVSGELIDYSNYYQKITGNSDPIHQILCQLKGKKSSQIFVILEIALRPEKYILPSEIENNSPFEIISEYSNKTIGRHDVPIFSKEEFRSLDSEYILPPGTKEGIQKPEESTLIFERIKKLQTMDLLIKKNDANLKMKSIKELYHANPNSEGFILVNGIYQHPQDRYIQIAKYLNWGIDPKLVKKVEELKKIPGDSGNGFNIQKKFSIINKTFFSFGYSIVVVILGICVATLFVIFWKTFSALNFMAGFSTEAIGAVIGFFIVIAIPITIISVVIYSGLRKYEKILRISLIIGISDLILYFFCQFVVSTLSELNEISPMGIPLIPDNIFNNFFDFGIPYGLIFIYLAFILGLIVIFREKIMESKPVENKEKNSTLSEYTPDNGILRTFHTYLFTLGSEVVPWTKADKQIINEIYRKYTNIKNYGYLLSKAMIAVPFLGLFIYTFIYTIISRIAKTSVFDAIIYISLVLLGSLILFGLLTCVKRQYLNETKKTEGIYKATIFMFIVFLLLLFTYDKNFSGFSVPGPEIIEYILLFITLGLSFIAPIYFLRNGLIRSKVENTIVPIIQNNMSEILSTISKWNSQEHE